MFIEYRKGVLNMGGTISEKELEKYDYLRAEYYKEKKSWPYTPRPLTNYEKAVIRLLLDSYGEYLRAKTYADLRAKTYADLPLSDLYLLINSTEKTSNSTTEALAFMKDKLLPSKGKGKNFSKMEVEKILPVIYTIYKQFVEEANKIGKIGKVIGVLDDESQSILGVLDGSKYYNKNKSGLAEKFLKHKKDDLKDFYFDPGDVMLLCTTVFKSIPQNAKDEIENRKTYLSDKKSRDYSDFMDMRKKMIELYNKREFAEGDELLSEYTGVEYELINGAARHSFSLDFGSKQGATSVYELASNKIIDEDLFIKGVIELAELREKLKESSWGRENEGVKYLYRGIPLYELLQRVRGEKMPKEWEKKHIFEENLRDAVAKYLVGKEVVDPAPSSTSLDISVAKRFSSDNTHGTAAILVIDVSKYRKGLNLEPISKMWGEKEILLPLGVKLKIKSVNFKKEGSDGYFEVNCVPV